MFVNYKFIFFAFIVIAVWGGKHKRRPNDHKEATKCVYIHTYIINNLLVFNGYIG